MSTWRLSWLVGNLVLVCAAACVNESTVGPVSPGAASVRVQNGDPPAGARLVGPITVSDGDRCSLIGDRGTREGATRRMQEAAKSQGMDYVKLLLETRPYSGHDCFHGEYTLQGEGYSLARARAPGASSADALPLGAALSALSAAPSPLGAPPVSVGAAPSAAPVAAASAALCSPPCSPGYACSGGVCVAECNPACGVAEVCRSDRVCVPAH